MEMFKLGIPVKTRHNEVSPAQFEIAPVFEAANLATDHNMLVMEMLQARSPTGMAWPACCMRSRSPASTAAASTTTGRWPIPMGNNLLEPGKTPHENAQFLFFLAAVVRAVYQARQAAARRRGGGRQRSSPGRQRSAAGDHLHLPRRQLTEIVENLIEGDTDNRAKHGGHIEVGVTTLPTLPKDTTDRNRTSPFAFTGNKFEFRAVGSSQSIAGAQHHAEYHRRRIAGLIWPRAWKQRGAGGKEFNTALQSLLQEVLTDSKTVLFNGDNYSEEWLEEATRRGLPNLKNMVDALPVLHPPEARQLFTTYGVFTERELESRFAIMLENYIKAINIEAQLTEQIARTIILPAAMKYQTALANALVATRQALGVLVPAGGAGEIDFGEQEVLLAEVTRDIANLQAAIAKLTTVHGDVHEEGEPIEHAAHFRDHVVPAMFEVRSAADALEALVDDEVWPLPKYREMLFIY